MTTALLARLDRREPIWVSDFSRPKLEAGNSGTRTAAEALPTLPTHLVGGSLPCLRLLDEQPDLAFQQRPLMPVDSAPDAVVGLVPHQWQQADDDVGAGRQ
jgi:hypothetical protein